MSTRTNLPGSRFLLSGGPLRDLQQLVDGVRMKFRQASQHPWVVTMVVGGVVGLGIRGDHFIALLERCSHHDGFEVLAEA